MTVPDVQDRLGKDRRGRHDADVLGGLDRLGGRDAVGDDQRFHHRICSQDRHCHGRQDRHLGS